MKRIGFHNREKELKEIMDILDAEPSLITFVYGPINSGKTALITHLIKQLPEDYVVFYINLRTKLLASYDDFIESLFEMELETEETNRKKRETLKELHLAHVFVITSDLLFIERVYSEAMLEGRCRYRLVDDFDCETATAFLETHGFTDDENATAWEYCGRKPVCLVELRNYENRGDKAKEMLMIRIGEIKTILKRVKALGSEILIEDKSYAVRYAELVDALKHFAEREEIDTGEMDEISTTFLVKKNVLFVDPVKGVIKPQSRLNLLAIREVMMDA